MSNTQEQIKKRREYLKQKRFAYTRVALATFCTLLLAWGTTWLIGYIRFMLSDDFGDPSNVGAMMVFPIILLIVIGLALVCGVGTYHLIRLAHQAHQEAKQLPYVPPVTTDSLPAEEVLVRGSEEPKQEQGKVLLRGTDGSTGVGEQELLRSSQGQDRS